MEIIFPVDNNKAKTLMLRLGGRGGAGGCMLATEERMGMADRQGSDRYAGVLRESPSSLATQDTLGDRKVQIKVGDAKQPGKDS